MKLNEDQIRFMPAITAIALAVLIGRSLPEPQAQHESESALSNEASSGRGSASGIDRSPASRHKPDPLQNYWKLSFADEFKGPPSGLSSAERERCYDTAPICDNIYNGGTVPCSDSASETFPALQALNKCVWKVHRSINWMSARVNEFDPHEIEVHPEIDNGVLLIKGKSVMPDGSPRPPGTRSFPSIGTKDFSAYRNWMKFQGYQCDGEDDASKRSCPIRSGMITSRSELGGFKQQFGLFQVRGKLASGPGAWPAFWMLPNASWPGGGEFDLMESGESKDQASQTFHSGVCIPGGEEDLDPDACKARGGKSWDMGPGKALRGRDTPTRTSLFSNYHSYTLEWDADKFAFRMDGVTTQSLHEGETVKSHGPSGKKRKQHAHIPRRPFWWLLNHTIGSNEGGPDPETLAEQTLVVDYVRAWQSCRTADDFCPRGGNFERGQCSLPNGTSYASQCTRCLYGGQESGPNCQIQGFSAGQLDPSLRYWADANSSWPGVYYKQSQGRCEHGGTISGGGNCQLVSLPAGLLEDQILYWVDSNPRWPGIYYQQTY